MFCIQCEQTLSSEKYTGCQLRKGKCGKDATTADLQDVLIYQLQGIGQYAHRARAVGVINEEVDRFIAYAFFTTLTNVNFDNSRFVPLIHKAAVLRDRIKTDYIQACEAQSIDAETLNGPAIFTPAQTEEGMLAQADQASLKVDEAGEDVFGLRCLILYGLKGCAAYADHALELGKYDQEIFAGFHQVLDFMSQKSSDINALLESSLFIGGLNYKIMQMLDASSTEKFGHPEISQVRISPVKGKAILVSGHDMVDLEAILKQTEGTGVNVYTHGELLPANAYPELKKYAHLAGNYGSAWQEQQTEFAAFPGAIVMTSNCMIDPNVKGYAERIFTSGPVGWPGVKHIENRDYSEVIRCAQAQAGFTDDLVEQSITTGFAHKTVLSVADKIIDGVKSGSIKHFFLIGGCDGAASGRNYYTDFAENTPDDTVMLTLGCGKYRFNKQAHGDIGGIPRLLDMGQCNDAYSAIQVALALADAFDCSVNDLPLTLIISWFEQKAAAVLLTLLHLGIKDIHLGPSLPAFLSDNLINVLVDKFELRPTGNAIEDMQRVLNVA